VTVAAERSGSLAKAFFFIVHLQQHTRQQTTTNDYCRQQTFVQRLGLDKRYFFAVKTSNTTRKWQRKKPTQNLKSQFATGFCTLSFVVFFAIPISF
jgi:hypothetical protein